jgi:hypothetical protein
MNNPIDFKKTAQNLNDVLFDVDLNDVYSYFNLPGTQNPEPVYAPYHKAIVNKQNGHIVSIVGKNYRLISNKEAFEMGKNLFCRLYPFVKVNELLPYNVITPAFKASAHIDLIHESVNFMVLEQEDWLPFLRISNSYNRSCALSFEIGFVRKLCSNGVMYNKQSTKLKYVHTNSTNMNLLTDAKKINEVQTIFINQCKQLSNYKLDHKLMFALICHILKINLDLLDNKQLNNKLIQLESLYNLVTKLTNLYRVNSDVNGYTVLNVVSDVVSHQNEYKNLAGFHFNVRSFYARPTDWMEEFAGSIKKENFDLQNYLEPTTKVLSDIEKEVGFKWKLN